MGYRVYDNKENVSGIVIEKTENGEIVATKYFDENSKLNKVTVLSNLSFPKSHNMTELEKIKAIVKEVEEVFPKEKFIWVSSVFFEHLPT